MGQDGPLEAADGAQFVARVANGDIEAIGSLYREYAGHMLDYLRKNRTRHGVAETDWLDVVHNTFAKLLRQPPPFDPSQELRPLLMTMVLNQARDWGRMACRRRKYEHAAGEMAVRAAAGAESIDASHIQSEHKTVAGRIVTGVRASDQEALTVFARSNHGQHVKAIAAATGSTSDAAQMKFLRAKERATKRSTGIGPRGSP